MEKPRTRREVVWSGLQPDVLRLVSERLPTRIDTFNFQLVCKNWNAYTSSCARKQNFLSSLFPLSLLVKDDELLTPSNPKEVVFVANSVFQIQSSLNSDVDPWFCVVEELNPGKLLLRRPIPCGYSHLPPYAYIPNSLNLSLFKVKEVLRFYTVKYPSMPNLFGKSSVMKLLLIANPNCKTRNLTINDYDVIALMGDGSLELISVTDLTSRTVRLISGPSIKNYDDLVDYKGSAFAIDRKGRAYTMVYGKTGMCNIVPQPVGEGSGSDRKKLIAVSSTGELYLIHRCPPYIKGTFKLYKLNMETKRWDDVEGIGDERILIVTSNGCFFVETKDFSGGRGNCMVFRKGLFPGYASVSTGDSEIFGSGSGHDYCSSELEVAVFHFGSGECKIGFSSLFWPPPGWLTADTNLLQRASIGEIQIIIGFNKKVVSLFSKEAEASSAVLTMTDKAKSKQGPNIIDIDSFPEVTLEACGDVAAQETFQGVKVSSNLVPILQKIWDKYGDIIQERVVSSDGLLTWALESLAKMVIILQTNSNRSLNDTQAVFLRTTIRDLQHNLHIKVDWLVPFLDAVLTPGNLDQ